MLNNNKLTINPWTKHIVLKNNKFNTIDIKLRERITILSGNTASGKTYIFNEVAKYIRQNPKENILCVGLANIGYEHGIIEKIKQMNNGLIIVDQANEVLKNTELVNYIRRDFDNKNNYILIGRSLSLNTKYSELAEPNISDDIISIKYTIDSV